MLWRRPVGGVVMQELAGDAPNADGTLRAGSVSKTHYLYHDHQGTVALQVSIGATGLATVESYFDSGPFGEARARSGNYVSWRGYTGHEHIDQLNTIHMNGRIYDPLLGRFLQPDPLVQAPGNSQNWNPYNYVLNNPLSYTDPSGNSFVKKYWRQIVAVAVTIVTSGAAAGAASTWAAAGWVTAGGFVSGAVATGTLRGGLIGAFSAAAFFGIGHSIEWGQGNALGTKLSGSALAGKTLLHGVTGGVMHHLQGGKFGHGFFSAGVTQLASGVIDGIDLRANRIMTAAMVGGSVSTLTGGKFANGAITAAFSRAFNDEYDNSGFRERAERYREMAETIRDAGIDTVWFDAAADLNEYFHSSRGLIASSVEDYLDALGDSLLTHNEAMFNDVVAGRLSGSGASLDKALVIREQTAVQAFNQKYFKGNISFTMAASMHGAFTLGGRIMSNSPPALDAGLTAARQENQGFNFFFKSHRIALGVGMMNYYRENR